MKINFEFSTLKTNEIFAKDYQKKVREINEKLHSDDYSAGTTWVHWPENYNKKEFTKIQKLAKDIKENSDALLVVGIGGSYLGAKSGLEMLAKKSKVEIIFAGINFDYSDLNAKLEYLKNNGMDGHICIHVRGSRNHYDGKESPKHQANIDYLENEKNKN